MGFLHLIAGKHGLRRKPLITVMLLSFPTCLIDTSLLYLRVQVSTTETLQHLLRGCMSNRHCIQKLVRRDNIQDLCVQKSYDTEGKENWFCVYFSNQRISSKKQQQHEVATDYIYFSNRQNSSLKNGVNQCYILFEIV